MPTLRLDHLKTPPNNTLDMGYSQMSD